MRVFPIWVEKWTLGDNLISISNDAQLVVELDVLLLREVGTDRDPFGRVEIPREVQVMELLRGEENGVEEGSTVVLVRDVGGRGRDPGGDSSLADVVSRWRWWRCMQSDYPEELGPAEQDLMTAFPMIVGYGNHDVSV